MTDKLRDAAQQALEALEFLYSWTPDTDPVVDAAITALRAALAQQAAQAVPQGWKLTPVEPTPEMRKAAADAWIDCGDRLILNKAAAALRAGIAAAPTTPAQQDAQAVLRQQDLKILMNRLENQAHRAGELWERCQGKSWPEKESAEFAALRDVKMPQTRAALAAMLNAAPTPPAPKPLGWLDRKAVECLQGPELNWMPAWNRPTSADPVPVFLGPPTRATLTASEILNMTPESIPAEHDGALLEYARAVIEAYEIKNGLKP